MTVVGIDGCSSGWVAVAMAGDGRVRAHHLPHIGGVRTAVPDARVLAIDIPIGLPDSGRRAADEAARSFLGRRRSSVFFTPVRTAVEAATHADATAAGTLATGLGVSRQAYALSQKILEVERWLPQAPCPVFEVHPEVSFAILLGEPAAASKKTWAGMRDRWQALVAAGIDLEALDGAAGALASVDDMLDAAAAAWSAGRVAAGTARSFPDPPHRGALGTEVAIWA